MPDYPSWEESKWNYLDPPDRPGAGQGLPGDVKSGEEYYGPHTEGSLGTGSPNVFGDSGNYLETQFVTGLPDIFEQWKQHQDTSEASARLRNVDHKPYIVGEDRGFSPWFQTGGEVMNSFFNTHSKMMPGTLDHFARAVREHESFGDYQKLENKGRRGRGAYQFDYPTLKTAAKRAKKIYKAMKEKAPSVYDDIIKGTIKDATQLAPEVQDDLFLSNLTRVKPIKDKNGKIKRYEVVPAPSLTNFDYTTPEGKADAWRLFHHRGKIDRRPAFIESMKRMSDERNFQRGGKVSTQGYRDDSPDRSYPMLNIPGSNITMEGVSRGLYLIPDKGQPRYAPPNSGNYNFPGASSVTEIPIAQMGGEPGYLQPNAISRFGTEGPILPIPYAREMLASVAQAPRMMWANRGSSGKYGNNSPLPASKKLDSVLKRHKKKRKDYTVGDLEEYALSRRFTGEPERDPFMEEMILALPEKDRKKIENFQKGGEVEKYQEGGAGPWDRYNAFSHTSYVPGAIYSKELRSAMPKSPFKWKKGKLYLEGNEVDPDELADKFKRDGKEIMKKMEEGEYFDDAIRSKKDFVDFARMLDEMEYEATVLGDYKGKNKSTWWEDGPKKRDKWFGDGGLNSWYNGYRKLLMRRGNRPEEVKKLLSYISYPDKNAFAKEEMERNREVPFIDRMYDENPLFIPSPEGDISHMLAQSDNVVYPTYVQEGNELVKVKGDPYDHAMSTGNYAFIMGSEDKAKRFAEGAWKDYATKPMRYGETDKLYKPTKLSKTKEKKFKKWTGGEDPKDYDLRGFYLSEEKLGNLKPSFEDYAGEHLYSIGQNGKILKSDKHPTRGKTMMAEELRGNKVRVTDRGLTSRPRYQQGGLVSNTDAQIGQPGYEWVPIQTEKGEMVTFADGTITPVKANKRHSQMGDDEATDIVPEGSFILSRDPKAKLDKSIADQISFGYSPVRYKEGELTEAPKEEIFGDIFKNKKELPATVGKAIARKFPVTDREDDALSDLSKRENKMARLKYIDVLRQMAEQRKLRDEGYQYGGMVNNIYNNPYDKAITNTMYNDPTLKMDNNLKREGVYSRPHTTMSSTAGMSGRSFFPKMQEGGEIKKYQDPWSAVAAAAPAVLNTFGDWLGISQTAKSQKWIEENQGKTELELDDYLANQKNRNTEKLGIGIGSAAAQLALQDPSYTNLDLDAVRSRTSNAFDRIRQDLTAMRRSLAERQQQPLNTLMRTANMADPRAAQNVANSGYAQYLGSSGNTALGFTDRDINMRLRGTEGLNNIDTVLAQDRQRGSMFERAGKNVLNQSFVEQGTAALANKLSDDERAQLLNITGKMGARNQALNAQMNLGQLRAARNRETLDSLATLGKSFIGQGGNEPIDTTGSQSAYVGGSYNPGDYSAGIIVQDHTGKCPCGKKYYNGGCAC